MPREGAPEAVRTGTERPPLRVLHVEDDPTDVAFAAALVGRPGTGVELRAVGTLAEAAEAARREPPDVILLDLTLPDGRGPDAVRQMRAAAGPTPIVILAGGAREHHAIDAVGLGVDDLLPKDGATSATLLMALRHAAQRHADGRRGGTVRPARAAVVGTRQLVLEGLAASLRGIDQLALVGLFGSIADLLAAGGGLPDVVVLEDAGAAGPDSPAEARARLGRCKLVVLADDVERHLPLVLDRRLDGVVLMTSSSKQIADALLLVLAGQVVLPGVWRPAGVASPADPLAAMSSRQLEILRLVADGCSNEQIARQLYISVNTVKFHLRSIYTQLGVHNRLQAAMRLTHPSG